MDHPTALRAAMTDLRSRLQAGAGSDRELADLLERLAPLFAQIERGERPEPAPGLQAALFHSEHPRHGAGTPLFTAQSTLLSALEGWRSKPWYPR